MTVQRFENSKIIVLMTIAVLQKHICVFTLVLLVCVTLIFANEVLCCLQCMIKIAIGKVFFMCTRCSSSA